MQLVVKVFNQQSVFVCLKSGIVHAAIFSLPHFDLGVGSGIFSLSEISRKYNNMCSQALPTFHSFDFGLLKLI